MTAPTVAVEWLLARAAVRATGLLHVVSRRDTGALNPVCGANPIRSREIETRTRLEDLAELCEGCGAMAASIGGTVLDGVALLLGLSSSDVVVRLLDLPVDAVHVHRDHARQAPGDGLEELVESVRERGVVQPIVVRRTDAGYELIAGARRLYAAHVAGAATIPAIVRVVDDAYALLDSLVENLHRTDLNPIEQANAYQRALAVLDCSKEALAQRLGISRSQVSNTIRLLGLPDDLQDALASGALTAAHGRALLRVDDPADQAALAAQIAAERLTGHDADRVVRAAAAAAAAPADPRLDEVASLLTGLLAARVLVTSTAKRTRIVIEVPVEDGARVLEQLGVQAAA